MTMDRSLSCLILCALVTTALTAQRTGLSGTWALKADAVSGQTDSGGTWSRDAMTGTLVIEQQGAAMTGTWTAPKGDPWPFTGRIEKDTFEFTTAVREVGATIDGRQTKVRFRWVFRGTAAGDRLTGTMTFDREGETSDRHQPFSAARK